MSAPPNPELILTAAQRNRKLVLPFWANVIAAGGVWLSCSNAIPYNYKITKIEVHCRDDTADNLEVEIWTGNAYQAAGAFAATGTNLLIKSPNTPYITGQGETIIVHCNIIPRYDEVYVKVHWNNTNAYALSGMVLVTVEPVTKEEAQAPIEEPPFEVVTKTPEEYSEEMLNKAVTTVNMAAELLTGTPAALMPPIKMFTEKSKEKTLSVYQQYMKWMNPVNFAPTTMPLEDRHKVTKGWMDGSTELLHKMHTDQSILAAVTSAFGIGVSDWNRWFESTYGLQQRTSELLAIAFEKAFLKPVEYHWNKMYRPEYPDTAELINMVVKEKITLDDFIEIMKYQGFDAYWSNKIWDAHFRAPDFSEVRQAIWREGITHDEIPDFLKRVDLDPFYNEQVWFKLLEQIPPYQDLINMRVKETITQEQFEKSIQTHGYYGWWAGKLWDAHFTPPQFMDFLLAMRRKQTTTIPIAEGEPITHTFGVDAGRDIQVVKDLSILADYDPRYWDFFRQRIYDDPTPRQARWGYEAGALTPEQVYDITKRHGFEDEDAKWFTDFTLKFQERPFITRYLNALMSAYIMDVIDDTELIKRVVAIPRREAIAEWIIKIADVRKEIAAAKPVKEKVKLLSVADLKKAYIFEKLTEDEFRTRLQLLGYETLDIEMLIDIIEREKEMVETGGKKTALSVAEMMNAFKFGKISEDQLRTDLMLRGLKLDEAQLLIDTKKSQWKMTGD